MTIDHYIILAGSTAIIFGLMRLLLELVAKPTGDEQNRVMSQRRRLLRFPGYLMLGFLLAHLYKLKSSTQNQNEIADVVILTYLAAYLLVDTYWLWSVLKKSRL